MPTLKELLAQIETLQHQASEARKREMAEAITNVRAIVEEYQLSVSDVFPSKAKGRAIPKSESKTRGPARPKYRDPQTGKTWSGRGLAPKWIAGKNKADFLIHE